MAKKAISDSKFRSGDTSSFIGTYIGLGKLNRELKNNLKTYRRDMASE
jgi:hypothetical protein